MERIGEYLIRRPIGAGASGEVFEAEERLSGRKVALKVLRSELASSEQGRRLFQREMSILTRLSHPNLVQCLSCLEDRGRLVMVLEYVDGQTLRERLQSGGPMPWREATAVLRQAAAALQAAHESKPPIIHRDLKPENIMVTASGRVKVMDFGIAMVEQEGTHRTTQAFGTLQYMSPEQIDATTLDGRSDLYALGLIYYELLTGQPPFRSESTRELLNLQCTAPPPPLPDALRAELPDGLEAFAMSLLEKRADARPTSASVVCRILDHAVPEAHAAHVTQLKLAPAATRPAEPATHGSRPAVASRRAVQVASGPSAGSVQGTVALVEALAEPRREPLGVAMLSLLLLAVLAAAGVYGVLEATMPAAWSESSEEAAR